MNDEDGLQFDITVDPVESSKDYYNTRELVIFAIDCTDSMFQSSSADDDSPFRIAMQCCRSVLMKKIIGSSSDYVGIVFFGTREKDPGDQYPKHVVTFFEPNQPNADVIKNIDAILKSCLRSDFNSEYGHSNDYALADVLWRCSSLIGRCTVKINIKKVILLTCNDFPHRDSIAKQHQVRKKVEDLESLGINLDVIPFKKDFDGALFYNDILKIVNGSDSKVVEGEVLIQELREGRYRKDSKKRSLGKLVWTIGEGVQLGVDLYCFYRHLTIPSVRKLHKKTNETVKSVTQTYHAETRERLLKSDLNQKIEIGNQQLTFNAEEKEKLCLHEKPGLTLLGFKSLAHLDPEYHVQTASFLYPDEDSFKGSVKIFKALLEKCNANEKFALCYMVSRARSKPRLVALMPQNEVKNEEVQVMPPGFHVVYLPFAEYVRDIELPKKEFMESEKVELCKKVLKKVTIKYAVNKFENPKVQTHWANIEALALNYAERRDIVDSTMPNYNFVSQCRLKDLENQFIETFYGNEYEPDAEAVRKRKYPTQTLSHRAVKVPKPDHSGPDFVIQMARAGKAEKLTISMLKQFLQQSGVSVSGFKKNDLVNAVYKELNLDP